MADVVGGPVDQLSKTNLALAEYYERMSGHISSGSSAEEFGKYIDRIEYDEILRRASLDAMGTADTATAVAVEEVHNNAAHVREYSMTVRRKSEMYTAIAGEYSQSADYHRDRAVLLSSILKGETNIGYLQ